MPFQGVRDHRDLVRCFPAPQVYDPNKENPIQLHNHTTTGETWRPVNGYEDTYAVSDRGRVKRLAGSPRTPSDRLRRPVRHSNGYRTVLLSMDGDKRRFYIHRLVAEAFLGPTPLGKEVNHRDGRKANNDLDNLEYVTRSENHYHAWRIGLR